MRRNLGFRRLIGFIALALILYYVAHRAKALDIIAGANCTPSTTCFACLQGVYPTTGCASGNACWATSCKPGGTGITTCIKGTGNCNQTGMQTQSCTGCLGWFCVCENSGCGGCACTGPSNWGPKAWSTWPTCF